MMRAQHYIGALLDNVAEGQIGSDEHRVTFAKIREKLVSAEDFEGELRNLYKVSGLTDFAVSLFWIAERVEGDPTKAEYSDEEQEMVVSLFRSAFGDEGPVVDAEVLSEPEMSEPEAIDEQSAAPEQPESVEEEVQPEQVPAEETPEMPEDLQVETTGEIAESEQPVYAPPAEPVSGTEGEFAALLEQFIESMQSGSDDRESLLGSVLNHCNNMIPEDSGVPDDLREFSQLLVEFLTYITENGFMDDVRVMNILSNVSGPVVSWAQSAPDERGGVLTEGLQILRSFKSLFE